MTAMPVRVLLAGELRALGHGWVRQRVLRAAERAQRAVVPPRGDGDVHDCAAVVVVHLLVRRPWRRGNRRAALEGTAVLYELNGYRLVNATSFPALFDAIQAGAISTGAVCERLQQAVAPVGAASRSPASGPR